MAKPAKSTEGIKNLAEHPEERLRRVTETAYFLAEKRGFEHGHDLDDWYSAEGLVASGAASGSGNVA